MKPLPPEQKRSGCDFWDVSQAACYLVNQACTLGGRHLRDGLLRSSFNREVAYYARGIVHDVDQGRKTPDEGMAALENEQRSLLSQAKEISFKGIGVVAGAYQLRAGAGICFASAGWLCPTFGLPMMMHGANNIYENGRNLAEGRSDTQGPVRKLYRKTAQAMGRSETEGDMAYGAVDIGMSVYGASRLLLKPDAWRLFRYLRSDYIRAYKTSGATSLTVDAISGGITLKSIHDTDENDN